MTLYTCTYRFEDRPHVVHVHARNEAEASRRLRAIGMTAEIDGELIAEIPMGREGGWLTKLRGMVGRVCALSDTGER